MSGEDYFSQSSALILNCLWLFVGDGSLCAFLLHVSTSVSVSTSLVQVVFRQHVGEASWVYLFIFETVSSYVALASLNPYVNQASTELREIGLILPPKCCD